MRRFDVWYHSRVPPVEGARAYSTPILSLRDRVSRPTEERDDRGSIVYRQIEGMLLPREPFHGTWIADHVAYRNHIYGHFETLPWANERVWIMASGTEFFSALKIQQIHQVRGEDGVIRLELEGWWDFKNKSGSLFIGAEEPPEQRA